MWKGGFRQHTMEDNIQYHYPSKIKIARSRSTCFDLEEGQGLYLDQCSASCHGFMKFCSVNGRPYHFCAPEVPKERFWYNTRDPIGK
jgi:hypothetical protein